MFTHLPDTVLFECGQEPRLLGLCASLLLVVELFGQLLGQSQISCTQKLIKKILRKGDTTYLNHHPSTERKRKTSERREPQPGEQVGNSVVEHEWSEQKPELRLSSRWK